MNRPSPNVILVMCDQWRPDCLGCLGHPHVRTPHLDALAAEGVVFENAYCASPLCSPARASWLTGLYPHAHGQLRNGGVKYGRPGAQLRADNVTLGDMFKRAGYHCGIIGPWHLGDDHVPQHGFEESWETYNYQGEGRPNRLAEYFAAQGVPNLYNRKQGGNKPGVAELEYDKFRYVTYNDPRQQRTTWSVDRAIEFVEKCDSDAKPFFLFLSVKDPHPTIVAPPELLDMYPADALTLPPNFHDPLRDKPRYQSLNRGRIRPSADPGVFREVMAHYYAVMTHVDRQLGRLLAELDRRGSRENTLVAFISDHGEMMGEHGFMGKQKFYEPSVRVPCLISWRRGLPGGQRIRTPIAGVDLAPTLLELADVGSLENIDGRSVAPGLRARRDPAARPVLAELCSGPAQKGETDDEAALAAHVMVRDGRWKYVWTRDDLDELYDLDDDPEEMTNLAIQPKSRTQIEQLRKRIREALVQTGPGPFRWICNS